VGESEESLDPPWIHKGNGVNPCGKRKGGSNRVSPRITKEPIPESLTRKKEVQRDPPSPLFGLEEVASFVKTIIGGEKCTTVEKARKSKGGREAFRTFCRGRWPRPHVPGFLEKRRKGKRSVDGVE